jgi:hypothetical protein
MGSAPYFFLDRVVDHLSDDLALLDLVAREDDQLEVLLPTPPPHVFMRWLLERGAKQLMGAGTRAMRA